MSALAQQEGDDLESADSTPLPFALCTLANAFGPFREEQIILLEEQCKETISPKTNVLGKLCSLPNFNFP